MAALENIAHWLPIFAVCFGVGCGGSAGVDPADSTSPTSSSPPAAGAPDGARGPGDRQTTPEGGGTAEPDSSPMPVDGGPTTFACPAGPRVKRSGAVVIDETWKKGVYEIEGVLDVTASLTLEAGAVLCFTPTVANDWLNAGINVAAGGALRTLGTRVDRVTLTVTLPSSTLMSDDVAIRFAPGSLSRSALRWTDLYSEDMAAAAAWHVNPDQAGPEPLSLERVGIHHGRLSLGDGGLTPASRVGIYDPAMVVTAPPRAAAALSFDSIVISAAHSGERYAALSFGNAISESVTLKRLRFPYVAGGLLVAGPTAPVLTLRAGVTLGFWAGGYLKIGSDTAARGDLVTEGTAAAPVTLRGHDLNSPGFPSVPLFAGLSFVGGPFTNTRVRGTIIEAAGAVASCTETRSLVTVISAPGVALPDIRETTFTEISSPRVACGVSVLCGPAGGCADAAPLQAASASNVFTDPASAVCNLTCPAK